MNDKERLTDEFDALFDDKEQAEDKVSELAEKASSSAEDLVTSIDQEAASAQDTLENAAEDLISEDPLQKASDLVDDTRISDEFDEIDFDDLDQIISLENSDDAPVFSEETASGALKAGEEAAQEVRNEVEDDVIAEADAFAEAFEDEGEKISDAVQEQEAPAEGQETEDDIIDPENDPLLKRSAKKAEEETELLDEQESEKAKSLTKDQLKKENRNFWIFTTLIALVVAGAVLFILYSRGLIFNDDTNESGVIVTTPEEPSSEADTKDNASESENVVSSEEESASSESSEESSPQETEEPSSSSEEVSSSEESSSSESEDSSSGDQSSEDGSSSENPETDHGTADQVVDSYKEMFMVKGAEMVNLRQEPSTDSPVLAKILEYGGGEFLEEQDGWYRVNSGGYIGYVSADYAVKGEEAQEIAKDHALYMVKVDTDMLNMREGPGTEYNVLEPVLMGTLWEYLGEEGDFYHVKYVAGMEGYLSKEYSVPGWFLREASKYYTED